MKSVLVLLFSLAIGSNVVTAQKDGREFQKFKGDISLGYTRFPSTAEIKNGFLIAVEPKFLVLDQLAIGGRFEIVLQGKDLTTTNSDEEFKIKMMQSFIATGEYYFTKDFKVRPFAGAGAGIYSVYDSDQDYYSSNDDINVFGNRVVRFGAMFRGGIEVNRLRFALEYNVVPNTLYREYDSYTGASQFKLSKNSYLSIKIGFVFGGAPLKGR